MKGIRMRALRPPVKFRDMSMCSPGTVKDSTNNSKNVLYKWRSWGAHARFRLGARGVSENS